MEMSRWLSEMGIDDSYFIDEYQMDTFGDSTPEQLAAAFGEDHQNCSSSDRPAPCSAFDPSPLELEATQTCIDKLAKQLKTADSGSSCTKEKEVLSVADKGSVSDNRVSQDASPNQNYALKSGSRKKRTTAPSNNPESEPHDHIIAERKRREKLSQHFMTLTRIVPGLKKMDKSSVLGDTITYLSGLQERVRTLEEQSDKQTTESAFFVKKYQIVLEDETSSTDDSSSNSSLPEIEARISGKNVRIRIHCEKQKGVIGKAVDAIEELNLSVVNCCITPFGTSTLDITVVAKMKEGFNMAVKDLLKKLRSSFCRFM